MKTYLLSSVGVLKTSLMAAAVYFSFSLLVVPFFILMMFFAPNSESAPFGILFMVFLPFLYAILGFIGTAIGCLIYNLVAKLIGGIELRLTEA